VFDRWMGAEKYIFADHVKPSFYEYYENQGVHVLMELQSTLYCAFIFMKYTVDPKTFVKEF